MTRTTEVFVARTDYIIRDHYEEFPKIAKKSNYAENINGFVKYIYDIIARDIGKDGRTISNDFHFERSSTQTSYSTPRKYIKERVLIFAFHMADKNNPPQAVAFYGSKEKFESACKKYFGTTPEEITKEFLEKFTADGSDFSSNQPTEHHREIIATTGDQADALLPGETEDVVWIQKFLKATEPFMLKLVGRTGFHPYVWIVVCIVAVLSAFSDIQHIATLMGSDLFATSLAILFVILSSLQCIFPVHFMFGFCGWIITIYVGLPAPWAFLFVALFTFLMPKLFKFIIKHFMKLVEFRPSTCGR